MFTAELDKLLTLLGVSRSFIWFTFAKTVDALQGQGKDLSGFRQSSDRMDKSWFHHDEIIAK